MSRSRLASLGRGLVPLALACHAGAFGATVITGIVQDATTDAPQGGVALSVHLGDRRIGNAVSESNGTFLLSFDVAVRPEAQNLVLLVSSPKFVDRSVPFQVSQGRATPDSHRLELVPRAVADCLRTREHAVVVGYFRPPAAGAVDDNLSARIAEALEYDLLTKLQQAQLPLASQPVFLACGGARPQATVDFTRYAKTLHADAFVSGYVDTTGPRKAKVQMRVADRHAKLVPPMAAASKDVNLDDPALARLDRTAHAAILTALVTGYEQAGKPADCIDFIAAVGRILAGPLPAAIAEAKARCEAALPNRALRRGPP